MMIYADPLDMAGLIGEMADVLKTVYVDLCFAYVTENRSFLFLSKFKVWFG